MLKRSGDRKLRRAVHDALVAELAAEARRIGVSVHAGAVTLVGWVTSHAQKDAASAAARRVAGADSVIDNTRVGLPSLPFRTHRPVTSARASQTSRAF